MAFEQADPCDEYPEGGTYLDIASYFWTFTGSAVNAPATSTMLGRFNKGAIILPSGMNGILNYTFSGAPAQNEAVIQFYFKISQLPTVETEWLVIRGEDGDPSASEGFKLNILPNGAFKLVVNPSSPTSYITPSGLVVADTWHYLEFQALVLNSGASAALSIDMVEVLSQGSLSAGSSWPASATYVGWEYDTIEFSTILDDILILNGNVLEDGYNYPIGEKMMTCLRPTADVVGQSNWTASSAGDNYADVDDAVPGAADGDATYNEPGGDNLLNVFDHEPITPGVTGIIGVMVLSNMRVDSGALDVGRTLTPAIRDPGAPNTDFGNSKNSLISASGYTLVGHDIFKSFPFSTPWTEELVNLIQFGWMWEN